MGLFDFLFRKSRIIEYPFWGALLFFKSKTGEGHFKGVYIFKPLNNAIISVFLKADPSGPTQAHSDFYKSIEDNYPAIKKSIIPVMEDEFGNWQEGFKIKDFEKEFTLSSISLPRCETTPIEWELSFDSIHDESHTFTILMKDYEATAVQIDG